MKTSFLLLLLTCTGCAPAYATGLEPDAGCCTSVGDVLAGSSLPNAEWRWASRTDGTMFKILPNDQLGVPWYVRAKSYPNSYGDRNDNTVCEGWNLNNDQTKGSLSWCMEDHYWNGWRFQSEFYFGACDEFGNCRRPIAFNTPDAPTSGRELFLNADTIQIGSGTGPSAGHTQFEVYSGAVRLIGSTVSLNVMQDLDMIRFIRFDGRSVFFFDADPIFGSILMRMDGGILPTSDGLYEIGHYRDHASFRVRWSNVVSKAVQPIDETIGSCDRDTIGKMKTVWDGSSDSELWWCKFDHVSGPVWEKLKP